MACTTIECPADKPTGTERGGKLVAQFLGVNTPDAAMYYRSTDFTVDEGGTWDTVSPRSGNLVMYDLDGTSDSNNIFGIGNPVVHDSLTAGYIEQLGIFGSVTGETLMVGPAVS